MIAFLLGKLLTSKQFRKLFIIRNTNLFQIEQEQFLIMIL